MPSRQFILGILSNACGRNGFGREFQLKGELAWPDERNVPAVIHAALKDMEEETLITCWKNLWQECVQDYKGFSPEVIQNEAINKAVSLAKAKALPTTTSMPTLKPWQTKICRRVGGSTGSIRSGRWGRLDNRTSAYPSKVRKGIAKESWCMASSLKVPLMLSCNHIKFLSNHEEQQQQLSITMLFKSTKKALQEDMTCSKTPEEAVSPEEL